MDRVLNAWSQFTKKPRAVNDHRDASLVEQLRDQGRGRFLGQEAVASQVADKGDGRGVLGTVQMRFAIFVQNAAAEAEQPRNMMIEAASLPGDAEVAGTAGGHRAAGGQQRVGVSRDRAFQHIVADEQRQRLKRQRVSEGVPLPGHRLDRSGEKSGPGGVFPGQLCDQAALHPVA